MIYFFYLLACVAVFSALMVVFAKNPIKSVIYLVICFLSIAGHYILLNAQFLAIVHIIVYTGAIMVLFLFVIMLMNLNSRNEPHKSNLTKISAVMSGGLLFLVLLASLKDASLVVARNPMDPQIGLVQTLGKVLYQTYMLPFEVTSVLFISAMVGAVMLSKRDAPKKS
ncbi:MAG: NADH-quinone oxidoreductase subunit J [Bacteroidota bacterium]